MAFVLVQHLAPDHKSLLSQLIGRYTRMQVLEVQDAMVVQANCVYIIAPNYDMCLRQGVLHLLEPAAPRGQRLPIDYFFQSLAQDQAELAIGIVLSGSGSDGARGVRAIKNAGGMVMAQNPTSCEFDGMPRSAIATGLVDYQLEPAQMPPQLFASKSANKANQHSLRVWSAGCSTGEEAYSLAILLFECISARYAAAGAARSQHQRPPVAATGLFRAAPNPADPAPGHRANPTVAGSARDQRAGRYGADIAAD